MRIYIAGPMESVGGNYNFPLFDYVAGKLRQRHLDVYSPADTARELIGPLEYIQKLGKQELKDWRRKLMARETAWICTNADAMAMLPGWRQSLGATAEHALAEALHLQIAELPDTVLLHLSTDDMMESLFGDEECPS